MDEQPCRSGGAGGLLVLLALVAVLIRFAVWICLAVGVIVLVAVLHRRLDRRAASREAIAGRADHQHRQVLAGDAAGIYGIYPPAMP